MKENKTKFLERTKEVNGCWEWQGLRCPRGYGRTTLNRKQMPAHRASWVIHKGEIDGGLFVLHKCDNKPCVNPSHLYLGTHVENARDRAERGQAASGERSGRAKLSVIQVAAIKEALAAGSSCASLGREYGVHRQTIHKIKNGENWYHARD
ncbi:MAG: HNH endonuclease [Oxalobacteraceae bacterium]|nr:MAG: HNH endonuclease [Oxalobacteraceae bacterium]